MLILIIPYIKFRIMLLSIKLENNPLIVVGIKKKRHTENNIAKTKHTDIITSLALSLNILFKNL